MWETPFREMMALGANCMDAHCDPPVSSSSTTDISPKVRTVRRPARAKQSPAPILYPEVPSFDPQQWLKIRERLRQIPTLHDFCESFLEAINLPAREWHTQDAQAKTCKIELFGKYVVEGKGETWVKARSRAALGVMMRLDRPLIEEWLGTHSEFLLAHFFQ